MHNRQRLESERLSVVFASIGCRGSELQLFNLVSPHLLHIFCTRLFFYSTHTHITLFFLPLNHLSSTSLHLGWGVRCGFHSYTGTLLAPPSLGSIGPR